MELLFLLFSGIGLGIMTSLNGRLAQSINVFTVSFFTHMIGAVLLLAYAKWIKRKKLKLAGTPSYIYFVGFMGITLAATSSFCAANIGSTATMSLSILGQIVVSTIIDHFGFWNREKIAFSLNRIPSYILILLGVFMVAYF